MFVLMIAAASLGSVVPAQEGATAPTTRAAPAAPANPEKKSCRREESTGSIMPGKRTCHTPAEWQQIDAANADNASNFRNRSRTTGGLSGG